MSYQRVSIMIVFTTIAILAWSTVNFRFIWPEPSICFHECGLYYLFVAPTLFVSIIHHVESKMVHKYVGRLSLNFSMVLLIEKYVDDCCWIEFCVRISSLILTNGIYLNLPFIDIYHCQRTKIQYHMEIEWNRAYCTAVQLRPFAFRAHYCSAYMIKFMSWHFHLYLRELFGWWRTSVWYLHAFRIAKI